MKDLNRIKGALYGVAVGDALGAPLEFLTAEQISQQHGMVVEMIGGGWLDVEPGEITDDTQMTLMVAQGITERPTDPVTAVGVRFMEWLKSYPKDVGGTCRSSILYAISAEAATAQKWHEVSELLAEQNGGKSGGNGALMRTVYPGLYYDDLNEAMDTAEDIAKMTHWDDLSNATCRLYTKMIYCMVRGGRKQDLMDMLRGTEYEDCKYQEMKPTGWVYDSTICALRCVAETKTFESAVVQAANLGGDADTIAAIAGGLAGAIYGYEAIPTRWIAALQPCVRSKMDTLVTAAIK